MLKFIMVIIEGLFMATGITAILFVLNKALCFASVVCIKGTIVFVVFGAGIWGYMIAMLLFVNWQDKKKQIKENGS